MVRQCSVPSSRLLQLTSTSESSCPSLIRLSLRHLTHDSPRLLNVIESTRWAAASGSVTVGASRRANYSHYQRKYLFPTLLSYPPTPSPAFSSPTSPFPPSFCEAVTRWAGDPAAAGPSRRAGDPAAAAGLSRQSCDAGAADCACGCRRGPGGRCMRCEVARSHQHLHVARTRRDLRPIGPRSPGPDERNL
jgi:hypothetical protein